MNLGEVEMLPPKGSLLWGKSFKKIGLTFQCISGILGWLMKQFWIRNDKGMRFLNPRYGQNELTFEHLSVEFMYIQNYRRKFFLTARKTCEHAPKRNNQILLLGDQSKRSITLPKFNSSPLKSYRNPIGKACHVFLSHHFSGANMLIFGRVQYSFAWLQTPELDHHFFKSVVGFLGVPISLKQIFTNVPRFAISRVH